MDDPDLAIRNLTYGMFVDLGRAPDLAETVQQSGLHAAAVAAAWRRLHEQHALVLLDPGDADGDLELRMANPFSAIPTRYRVQAAGRDWFGNCAWDAFGIPAALHSDGRIRSACPDCGEPIDVRVQDGQPDTRDLVFHCLVPAAGWWDDIVFT